MAHKAIFTFLLSCILLVSAGCGSEQTRLTAADNGKTIHIPIGGTVSVTLDSNPTTGYSWEIKSTDASYLSQSGASYQSSNTGLVGAGGTQTLKFKAEKAGQTNLTLVYHRSWETDVAPLDTYMLTVVIQ